MIERIDCHSHSAYSGHGSGSIAEMLEAARTQGLTTFAQTEHLVLPEGMDPTFESSMSLETMKRYLEELHELRDGMRGDASAPDLIIGIEADWMPSRIGELEELCAPFEYVLGSIHFLDKRPFDDSRDLSIWDEEGVDGVWRMYLDSWLEMAAKPGPITAFAHPDLPKKYGWMPSFDVREYYHEMATRTTRMGRIIEVNTAGLRKDVRQMYPALELLRSFRDAGVDCTIGSDAHAPADVAANYEDAVELMRQAGYEYVTAPRSDGDRRYIRINA